MRKLLAILIASLLAIPLTSSATARLFGVSSDSTVSGTLTLFAQGDDPVNSIAFEYRPAGVGAWFTIRTLTSPPYVVSFDTTTIPVGAYDFRARVQDATGETTDNATNVTVVAPDPDPAPVDPPPPSDAPPLPTQDPPPPPAAPLDPIPLTVNAPEPAPILPTFVAPRAENPGARGGHAKPCPCRR